MTETPDELPPIRPFRFRLSAVAVSLGLVAGFVVVRSLIYALVPANNAVEWNLRDTIMDVPRALFGFFAWRYGRRLWKPAQLGLHWRKWREGAMLGSLLCATALVRPFLFPVAPIDWAWFPVLVLSSIAVSAFEELLFRSLLLRALYDQYGSPVALWGTTAAFMLFHVQAQPLRAWPMIFIIGFWFALMRLHGVSLWVLVIAHSLYDAIVLAYTPATGELPPFWMLSNFLVDLYIVVMYAMAYRVRILVSGTFW